MPARIGSLRVGPLPKLGFGLQVRNNQPDETPPPSAGQAVGLLLALTAA